MAKKTAAEKTEKTKSSAAKEASAGTTAMFESHPMLKNTVAQIEKEYGEGAIMSMGGSKVVPIAGIPTGSLSLDLALGGQGIPSGRVVEIFGPESSGKTTLALHVVAQAQRRGGIAAFIDAEHAFDPTWAKKLGVDLETLLVSQPSSGRRSHAHRRDADQVECGRRDRDRLGSRPGSRKELEGEIGDSHVGLQARLMSQSLRKLTGAIARARRR